MACQIQIEGISAGPPYVGSAPLALTVTGRASADCLRVRVEVRVTTATSPVLFTTTVETRAAGAVGALPRSFSTVFYPPQQLSIACGVPLFVAASCQSDATCRDAGAYAVACKPAPTVPGGTPGGGQGTPSWPWPDPPSTFCIETARTFAILLSAGASALALGIAAGSAVAIGAALGLLGLAAAAYAVWTYWCAPDECVRLRAICWAMKRAFIVAIPLPFVTAIIPLVFLSIAYGWIAGVSVVKLQARRCVVPSSRWSLGQVLP